MSIIPESFIWELAGKGETPLEDIANDIAIDLLHGDHLTQGNFEEVCVRIKENLIAWVAKENGPF